MLETILLVVLYITLCYSIPVWALMMMNKEQPTSAEGAAPEIAAKRSAIDPELRSSKRYA